MTEALAEVLKALPDKPLLRVEEVAAFFQISRRTVYAWYETDKIKGTNLNGVLRIYRQTLLELITEGNGKKAKEETEAEVEKKLQHTTATNTKKHRGWVKNY